jgi:hypothetical protein
MKFVRQLAVLGLAVGAGLFLAACQPSTATAPRQPSLSDSLVLTPSAATLAMGSSQGLTVKGSFSDGSSLDVTSGATFASSNTSVATVSATGFVTAVRPGTATITATYNALGKTATGTATITVPKPAVVAIAATPTLLTLAPGGATQALSVTATYADATSGVITSNLTFISSNTAAATVSPAGVITTAATGSATITVTETGSGATAKVAVTVIQTYAVLDFNTPGTTYTLTPFGGAAATLTSTGVPAGGPGKQVVKLVKTAGAACYAGATLSVGGAFSIGRIPFSATATTMSVQMYVAVAGVDIKLKVENANNGAVSVETDVTPTATGWQTLIFDFSKQAPGTPALDPTQTYNKISIFADFTCANNNPPPAKDEVFYVGPITFIGASGPSAPPLPPPSYVVVDYSAPTFTPKSFGGDQQRRPGRRTDDPGAEG